MDVRLPDGTVIKNVPDGMSKADLTAKLKANGYDVSKLEALVAPPSEIPGARTEPTTYEKVREFAAPTVSVQIPISEPTVAVDCPAMPVPV